jgi:hypothetical protein
MQVIVSRLLVVLRVLAAGSASINERGVVPLGFILACRGGVGGRCSYDTLIVIL